MKIDKPVIYTILNRLFFWTLINFSLNLFGLWFSKLILNENFIFPESVSNEFVTPILIQSLLFGICFGTAFVFIKNKKISWLGYAAFQFVVFHISFLSGLKFTGGLHFETSIGNTGLRYLSYHGQYLIDFIFTNKPLSGFFENGIFKPNSTLLFYIEWVFSVIVYFVAVSWINEKVATFFSTKKIDIKEKETSINDI